MGLKSFTRLPALGVSTKALPAASVAMIPTVLSKLRRVFDVVLVPSVLLGADVLCLARVASLRGVPRTMVRLRGFDAHGVLQRARLEDLDALLFEDARGQLPEHVLRRGRWHWQVAAALQAA